MQRFLVLLAVIAMILAGVSFSEAQACPCPQACPGSRAERLAQVQADLEAALVDREVRAAPSVERILSVMERDQHCATLEYAEEIHQFLQSTMGWRCRSAILHWLLASNAAAAYAVMWQMPPLKCGIRPS